MVASYKQEASNFLVELEHLYNCANVRDLVGGHMFPVNHITKPQAFKISKDPTDGRTKLQVQSRSYNQDWGVLNRYDADN